MFKFSNHVVKITYSIITTFIIVCLCLSVSASQRYDYLTGGFSSIKAKNLTFMYSNGSDSVTVLKAVAQWNNRTSKVKIRKGTSYSNADIKIDCNKTYSSNPKLLGITRCYKNGKKVNFSTKNIDYVCCTQYINSNLNTSTKKIGTTVHELGHALSLAHPTTDVNSIMNQGTKKRYKLYSYDIEALKSRWGI